MNKIILIFTLAFINSCFASSALYYNNITGEHYLVRNQASGNEAQPKALEYCLDDTTKENCELIYKTDYGGYGAIALGDKNIGYIWGSPTQALADKVAIRNCVRKAAPKTCRITSRWHDIGKRVPIYSYHWVPDDDSSSNSNSNPSGYCGTSRSGLAINCGTGFDSNGGSSWK